MENGEYIFENENGRFVYVRTKWWHGVQDTLTDGKYIKGNRTTYNDFDLDKLSALLNEFYDEKEMLRDILEEVLIKVSKDTQKCVIEVGVNDYDYFKELLVRANDRRW